MSYANWSATAYYLSADIVNEGSTAYSALAPNINKLPSANPLLWSPVSTPGGGLANVITTDGSGILSVVAGDTATLSSALVHDPNLTLTPSAPPSKDLTIGLNADLTSIHSINDTITSAYGWVDIVSPDTTATIVTQRFVTPFPIISLTFVNDGSPNVLTPSNEELWYDISGPDQFTINLSSTTPVVGMKFVVAWNLLKA
jgi:hypothetical protein